jgi:hypothetical protein
METAKGRNQMTDIQLLVITETLQQIGNQIGKQIVTMKQDTNDFKIYLSNGQMIKIDSCGGKGWFLNGEHHLEDGPALEYDGGTKVWCQNNIVHKIEYKDSKTCRWQKQLFHLNQLMKKKKAKKKILLYVWTMSFQVSHMSSYLMIQNIKTTVVRLAVPIWIGDIMMKMTIL